MRVTKNHLIYRLAGLAAILLGLNGGAQASTTSLDFTWTGSDGYTMTGSFSYDSSLTGPITGAQLESFSIEGLLDGTPIGSWDLATGYAGYEFNFNFDATTLMFAQGGLSSGSTGQDWNDITSGVGCPDPGFGFSSGAGSQGVCVNNGGFEGSTSIDNLTVTSAASPEPASEGLVAPAGLGMIFLWVRRSRGSRRQ